MREIISNILAHRDYSNAYMAQFVIEIIMPMSKVASLQIGPEGNSKENNKENSKEINGKIIDILLSKPEISVKEIAAILNITTGKIRYYIE
ncbi:MAG: winged helix-turn-helix domain-containing protein, partial [Lachnospiraceae bacterium]|nr:winged helix-turn-helix domain-containing protein [Lachnospiraceae bacterium]